MTMLDWAPANFSAFAGPAKLDATFLQDDSDGGKKKLSLEAEVSKFHKWINILRADPKACGIPLTYLNDVKLLLQTFFPFGEDGKSVKVQRVCDQGLNSGERTANPVTVTFGSSNTPLKVVDASTALGYIFSVVKPTMEVPTWEIYYLPLLAIYSRCLYLAFIGHSAGRDLVTSVTDVPRRCCVMYVGKDAAPQRYMFSADFPTLPSNLGGVETERRAQVNMLNAWRQTTILDQAIQWAPRSVGQDASSLPKTEPWYRRQLADLLYRNLYLHSGLSKALQTTWAALTLALETEYLNGSPQKVVVPLPLARLKGHAKVGSKLDELLLAIVDLKLSSDRNPTVLHKALFDFIRHFITPHMFLAGDLVFAAEESGTTASGEALNAAFAILWPTVQSDVLQVLDALFSLHRRQKIPHNRAFGRCAETYCITSLLPNYFSWLDQRNPSMSDVRGIALNVLDVDSSLVFGATSASAELGKSSVRAPYSRPCENCTCILPQYRAVLSDTAYNADLMTASA